MVTALSTTPDRQCGSCTLCCKLLPVNELGKLAGERCKHQYVGGCRVYTDGRMPSSCRLWNCRWITSQLPRDMRRPDRAHYVIDIMPDYSKAVLADGKTIDIPVMQIWCDPDYKDAHKDPALRAWLDENHICGLVRYGSSRAKLIGPPSVNAGGVWYEGEETDATMPSHTLDEIVEHTGATVTVTVEED
jgi:hypothetical protein